MHPTVWLLEVTTPAVVLGSTQAEAVVRRDEAEAAGVDVVRRRSGGSAVWLHPDDVIWIDVVLPTGHPGWFDDVGRAAVWLGSIWRDVFVDLGVSARVHDAAMVHSSWSSLVCFAGVGTGEVFVDDAKLVGISQRRTREGSRFQCAIHRRWRPDDLLAFLDTGEVGRVALDAVVASGVGLSDIGLDLDGHTIAGVLAARLDNVTRSGDPDASWENGQN